MKQQVLSKYDGVSGDWQMAFTYGNYIDEPLEPRLFTGARQNRILLWTVQEI